MELKRLFLPQTKIGKLAVCLIIAFFVLLIIENLIVKLQGPRADQTFLDNPLLALTMFSAGLSAIASFFTGIFSVIKKKERAISVLISSFIGMIVLFFVIGEFLTPH